MNNAMSNEEKSDFEKTIREEARRYLKPSSKPTSMQARVVDDVQVLDPAKTSTGMQRLQLIEKEMSTFKGQVDKYVRAIKGPSYEEVPVQQTRQVTVLEPLSWRNIWGFLGLIPRKEQQKTEKYTVMERKEIAENYNLEDLQGLVRVCLGKLKQYNGELDKFGTTIEDTVEKLVHKKQSYNRHLGEALQAYEASKGEVEGLEQALTAYDKQISSLRGTDEKKWELESERDELRVKLAETKSDVKIYGETAQFKNEYRKILDAYTDVLSDTKEEARRWVKFIENFVGGTDDVNVTMENVYQVCNHIAMASGTMQETMGHVKFLGSKLGAVYSIVKTGDTPPVEAPVDVQQIRHEITERGKMEQQYRSQLGQAVEAELIEPAQYAAIHR